MTEEKSKTRERYMLGGVQPEHPFDRQTVYALRESTGKMYPVAELHVSAEEEELAELVRAANRGAAR